MGHGNGLVVELFRRQRQPADPDEVVGYPADQVGSELVTGGDAEFGDHRGLTVVEAILGIQVLGRVGIDPEGMGHDRAVGADEIQIGTGAAMQVDVPEAVAIGEVGATWQPSKRFRV